MFDQKNDKSQEKINERMNKIKHKIMVISGKGGVGKSSVAVNLSYGLALMGKRVGLLDVDIHGPSIGKMMGIEKLHLSESEEKGVIDPITKDNIKVVSMASLMPETDQPVIWRGPLKMRAISQFLSDINWGELDYLIVDCPPGTGDEPLSIAQLIGKLDGTIVVTTPQDVSLLDASKTVNFSKMLNAPVLGIVENMSGFICPHCGGSIDLFKSGGGKLLSEKQGVKFLGAVPFDMNLVQSSDKGRPFIYDFKESPAGKQMMEITREIIKVVEEK